MNETKINVCIDCNDRMVKPQLPVFSELTTNNLTNSKWQVTIASQIKNNIEWVSFWLKLIEKPVSIETIDISFIFRISDITDYNIRSMVGVVQYTSDMQGKGYPLFVPLKIIENWKEEINFNCWFAIQNVNKQPWMNDQSLINEIEINSQRSIEYV